MPVDVLSQREHPPSIKMHKVIGRGINGEQVRGLILVFVNDNSIATSFCLQET
jgi:hypothetical protein